MKNPLTGVIVVLCPASVSANSSVVYVPSIMKPYSQTMIDLSGLMVSFPDGLMRVGNVFDEINLNTQRAYSRIQKLEYTAENLEDVIDSGVPYDTDTNYIYAVRETPVTLIISLSGEYTVSDHGIELFNGTTVPLTAYSLYGQDLKGKLRRDVLTISQQTLTAAQKAQILENIGAGSESSVQLLQNLMPTGALKNELFENDDLNNITSGSYFCTAVNVPIHAPETAPFLNAYIFATNFTMPGGTQVMQMYITFQSGVPFAYVRRYWGTWGKWYKFTLTAEN